MAPIYKRLAKFVGVTMATRKWSGSFATLSPWQYWPQMYRRLQNHQVYVSVGRYLTVSTSWAAYSIL